MKDAEAVPLKKFAGQIGYRYSTVWRWWRKGILNRVTGETVKLETFRYPVIRCTTREAYNAFVRAINRSDE